MGFKFWARKELRILTENLKSPARFASLERNFSFSRESVIFLNRFTTLKLHRTEKTSDGNGTQQRKCRVK